MLLESSRRYYTLKTPQASIITHLNLDGIKYDGAGVRFDNEVFSLTQAAVLSASILNQTVNIHLETGSGRRADVATNDNLKIVNERHTERDFTLDELFFYERMPVNNVPSRTIGLMFTERALGKFASDAGKGRSRLRGHDRRDIIGRIFRGEVVDATVREIKGKFLRTVEYIPRSSGNETLILNVESGVYSFDSIGFTTGSKIDVREFTDDNGKTFTVIEIDYDPQDRVPLELREASFVHLGEMKGAGSNQPLGAHATAPGNGDILSPLVSIHAPVEVSRTNNQSSLWDICV